MKKILGLDLGTNSIGWAVVNRTDDEQSFSLSLSSVGSRIIPMDAAIMGDFAKGNSVSQTKDRTQFRGTRRLYERFHLRRERLLRTLSTLNFLPEHFSNALTRYGKFTDPEEEPKIAWAKDEQGKMHFVFQTAFEEMLSDFRNKYPELLANGLKIPYDWTIYYLRKKALTQALSPEELSWLLLHFNQKRGYYQLRGEEEGVSKDKQEEYLAQRVVSVINTGEKKGKATWFDVVLENGMIYHRAAEVAPDWVGKIKEFIVTTPLDKDGKPKVDKEGQVRRTFRMPGENDWTLLKKKTEADIDRSRQTVGEYIYTALLNNPKQKINGKLVRVIERDYYKEELRQILQTQQAHIAQLNDRALYARCIETLYPSNAAYRNSIANRDFTYLFLDNIIFYQRPLKSKKSLIDECPYETITCKDNKTGEKKEKHLKCIAKSHPLYQEFRLWQFVGNLRIYQRHKEIDGRTILDADVTQEFLSSEQDWAELFKLLNDRENISQDELLFLVTQVKTSKGKPHPYRWNYVEDKEYPCNSTRGTIIKHLKRAGVEDVDGFLSKETSLGKRKPRLVSTLEALWHILYSVADKTELRRALTSFAEKHSLPDTFVDVFASIKPFEKEYGAYSAKALKRLLPLMRMGEYWHEEAIDKETKERIQKLIDGEWDETISNRAREKSIGLSQVNQFRALPLWLACYVVYNRHSEASDTSRWSSPSDIDTWLQHFHQHSMRNPIVEQVVTETMRTVRDIWKKEGRIDEIHIELGREMKNPADKRKRMSERIIENENANLRAKILLAEMLNPQYGIEGVRPYSPSQQEILRIYEDGARSNAALQDEDNKEIDDIIARLSQADTAKQPTPQQIRRYLHWLEQNYRSPYTGEVIPLARLFTADYEIEHVIPQSRYFDDSFTNKVICEAEVNKLKDNLLGMEFIQKHHGEKVQLSRSRTVTILSVEEYTHNVETQYASNKTKMRKLLMDDIPDGFIERQLNDSRYISRYVKALLSHIVREEDEQEATSKNIIVCNGSITDRLKKDWGVNDVWNHIILPRFQRLNTMTGTSNFTTTSNGHEIPTLPLELQRGFNKKRIDHRHHAMDAIVIACTTRDHVNLLNNEAAMSRNNANRYQLSYKLRRQESVIVNRDGERRTIKVFREFFKPWPTFTADVENALRTVVVSFKQNLRVINKTSNKYVHYEDGRKTLVHQTKGDAWAIRKPMHKDTIFGEINLRRTKDVSLKEALTRIETIVDKDLRHKLHELCAQGLNEKQIKRYLADNKDVWQDINPKKIAIYYFTRETSDRFFATRKPLDTSFTEKKIREEIADTAIQKILLRHLKNNGGNAELAFSPDGIDEMNRNIVALNDGRQHQPIFKVRVYEKADKFQVGQRGNRKKKFVEAAKGTNLFFAVYETETIDEATGETVKKRTFSTIPLNVVIDRQKQGLPSAPENAEGQQPRFVLSPNDLVYVPTEEERKQGKINMPLEGNRIYKMVSSNKYQCFFIPATVATAIINKYEYSSANKQEKSLTGEMIKDVCLPLRVNRLGEVTLLQQP